MLCERRRNGQKERKKKQQNFIPYFYTKIFFIIRLLRVPICNIDQHAKKVSFKNKIFISTMNILFVLIRSSTLYIILLTCGKYEE